MTDEFRVLCAELVELCTPVDSIPQLAERLQKLNALADRARALLAEPEAVGPNDEEIISQADKFLAYSDAHMGDPARWEGSGVDLVAFTRHALDRWGRPTPQPEPEDCSQISDGYHTFAELYEHRHSLMLALMRAMPGLCWFSQRHSDGELPFGSADWFIVGADLPTGAITYHLPIELLPLARQTGAAELAVGRPWDGHTASDVIERMRAWASTPQPPADGEVVELVKFLREQVHACLQAPWTPGVKHFGRAAFLLEQRHPAPVPVSERLPSAADCDVEDNCWWFDPHADGAWYVDTFQSCYTHWLPANALPTPEAL